MIRGRKLQLWFAFFIPFFIMSGICIVRKVYPFGDQCILHIDLYHQYAPFYTEFMNQMKEGGSLAYTWKMGLGTDLVSTMAYYFASPVNWLLVFCPRNHVIEFMSILILLKISAAGWSFAYYLRKHYEDEGILPVWFSVFYSLSGFVCAYYWNIMWLDALWLTPFVILGLERLVKEGRCLLYFSTLALTVFSNYYIAIMVCIFLLLYFLILLGEIHSGRIRAFGRFFVSSLLAGGCGAVLILPEIAALAGSGSGGIRFPDAAVWYFGLADELARMCMGVQVIATTDHWPSLYCGVAALFLFFLFLMNREIPRKRRLCLGLLVVFFLLSFAENQLDFIWHGLHFPDGLPARQTFLYAFLLLVTGYEAVHLRQGIDRRKIFLAWLLAEGILLVCDLFADKELVTPEEIRDSGIVLAGYAIFFLMWQGQSRGMKKILVGMLTILICVEAYVNMGLTSLETTDRTIYTEHQSAYQTLAGEAGEREDGFYRIDTFSRLTKNESALNHYPSASIFSSLINVDVATAYRELGMEGGKNYYCYNGATMLTSALLDVRYLMTDSDCEESPYRRLTDSKDGIYLYENLYTLPLGVMLRDEVMQTWDFTEGSSIDAQNRLAFMLGAEEPLLVPVNTTITPEENCIEVQEDGYYYGFYTDKDVNRITMTVGERTRNFSKCGHVYLLDFGYCHAGEKIVLTSTEKKSLQVQGYRLQEQAFLDAYRTLERQTMELERYTDTRVEGRIKVTEQGSLFLAIPDDVGWKVSVDGAEVTPDSFCDAFLCIPLDEGEHQILLQYRTPYFIPGLMISLISLIAGLLFCFRRSFRHERQCDDVTAVYLQDDEVTESTTY